MAWSRAASSCNAFTIATLLNFCFRYSGVTLFTICVWGEPLNSRPRNLAPETIDIALSCDAIHMWSSTANRQSAFLRRKNALVSL